MSIRELIPTIKVNPVKLYKEISYDLTKTEPSCYNNFECGNDSVKLRGSAPSIRISSPLTHTLIDSARNASLFWSVLKLSMLRAAVSPIQ